MSSPELRINAIIVRRIAGCDGEQTNYLPNLIYGL